MSMDTWLEGLVTVLTQFVSILGQEAEALGNSDAEALAGLASRKELQGRELARLWQGLSTELGLQEMVGLPMLRECVSRGILPAQSFDRLEGLCLEAERQNRVNGKLIEEQIRRTQAAMNILQQAAASHSLYGADGRMTGATNRNRSIGSA